MDSGVAAAAEAEEEEVSGFVVFSDEDVERGDPSACRFGLVSALSLAEEEDEPPSPATAALLEEFAAAAAADAPFRLPAAAASSAEFCSALASASSSSIGTAPPASSAELEVNLAQDGRSLSLRGWKMGGGIQNMNFSTIHCSTVHYSIEARIRRIEYTF